MVVEELVQQSLLHFNHISLVDLMGLKETPKVVVQVETTVVLEVVLLVMLLMLMDPELLELVVVVMVVLEKKFQQHTYQTLLHRQILDHHLDNS